MKSSLFSSFKALAKTSIICLIVAFVLGPIRVNAQPVKPDILLIMPDQMRGDCMSGVGHPVVRTPNLDKLAKAGALFRRAYSTCPSCIPARFSLLTGLFPATSGVVGFQGKPIEYPTLPQLLADAGYTTMLVGRCMHQKPDDEHYGYQTEVRGSTYVAGDQYDLFLKSHNNGEGIRELVARIGVSYNGWEAKPWPLAEDLHPTAWTVAQARKALKEVPTDKPLFLTTSFFTPHPPLFPPKRFFDYYSAQKLPAPAQGDWVDWKDLSPKGDKPGHRVLLQGDTLRATQAGYFGLIEFLDEQIGSLIVDFKARSRDGRRPWLIVVTSDHGEMLGDNGFFRKCEPFEGSANIPLIIAASGAFGFPSGVRCNQPVCLEDIMPTLLQAAGTKHPKAPEVGRIQRADAGSGVDGVSLAPILRGEDVELRTWLHSEHAPCYSKEQAFHALTDGHFKYIWRPLDGTEYLFDLDKDPHEEHDLSKVEAQQATLEKWRGRLIHRLAGRPEGFSEGTKLIAGRPYPALQKREVGE
ncbi:MAG: arylsulfatase [Verrucomicrobia bacterium]|nr:MAG: arylsulfatase [Verrucomicrobiota bacterium]